EALQWKLEVVHREPVAEPIGGAVEEPGSANFQSGYAARLEARDQAGHESLLPGLREAHEKIRTGDRRIRRLIELSVNETCVQLGDPDVGGMRSAEEEMLEPASVVA